MYCLCTGYCLGIEYCLGTEFGTGYCLGTGFANCSYPHITLNILELTELILLFSIVRNEISVSSVKSQVTSLLDCSLRVFSECHGHCHSLYWSGHVSSSI